MQNLFCEQLVNKLPKGGWRYADTDIYRTKDGRAFFEFGFYETSGTIEIDILEQPDYEGRNTDAHSTHRLSSPRGGKKICFGDENAINRNNAKKWAAQWAENTWEYIRTGKTF